MLTDHRPAKQLSRQNKDRKGGTDWFIYPERTLKPLLLPFALAIMKQKLEVMIMEDNTPDHIHHYNLKAKDLGLKMII